MSKAPLLTPGKCALVGMVHLLPLPGSPRWGGDMNAVLDAARRDAGALVTGGCDLLLVENMGDVPYLRGSVAPETVRAMIQNPISTSPLIEFLMITKFLSVWCAPDR